MAKKTKSYGRAKIKHAEIVVTFAARLRELRISRGLTQQDLARASQISVPYASRLERAETAPGIDLLGRLASALKVSPAELLPTIASDPAALLKGQAERHFRSILDRADQPTLTMLVPWLTLLNEHLIRSR